MKHLLLLFLLAVATGAAAKVPNEELILDRTMNAASPFYYPALMMRYNSDEPKLSDEEFHYLYYGYAYRDEYKPLAANPELDKLLMLASGINLDKPDRTTAEHLIALGNEVLQRDPFNPKVLNIMSYAYGVIGDKKREKAYSDRMYGVIRTILDSGDGFTQKTPRHVLMFDHALDLLSAENLSYGKARIVSRTVEFVPLVVPYVVDGKKRKGFYFNFERVYWNKPEGYTYQRSRTWQFNNLKPRTYK